jgi:hypothetical protein
MEKREGLIIKLAFHLYVSPLGFILQMMVCVLSLYTDGRRLLYINTLKSHFSKSEYLAYQVTLILGNVYYTDDTFPLFSTDKN